MVCNYYLFLFNTFETDNILLMKDESRESRVMSTIEFQKSI